LAVGGGKDGSKKAITLGAVEAVMIADQLEGGLVGIVAVL
jgi:hypothetical protein